MQNAASAKTTNGSKSKAKEMRKARKEKGSTKAKVKPTRAKVRPRKERKAEMAHP